MLDFGFLPVSQRGSHVKFKHADGRAVSIPHHARREISRGLLLAIVEEAELDPAEFFAAFR
jgi:predicted RNA binding protein YcfA (HicA-like mRNA interferase family)